MEFTVAFTEDVEASGASLTLTGGRIATISSGSGTDTLTFSYVVASNESAADIDILGLAGVTDEAGNIATLDASTLDTSVLITPPAGEVHVYDDAGMLVAVYSTAVAPADHAGSVWIQNAYPINAAVNASSAGFTVMVGSGQFSTGGSPITITQDGLRLIGAQTGVDPSTAAGLRGEGDPGASIVTGSGGTHLVKVQADNTEINGFVFNGAGLSVDILVTDGASGNAGAKLLYNIAHNSPDDASFSITTMQLFRTTGSST